MTLTMSTLSVREEDTVQMLIPLFFRHIVVSHRHYHHNRHHQHHHLLGVLL